MKITWTTKEEMGNWGFGIVSFMEGSDLVVADGVIVKNRQGKTGARVGNALFVWDEEPADGREGHRNRVA